MRIDKALTNHFLLVIVFFQLLSFSFLFFHFGFLFFDNFFLTKFRMKLKLQGILVRKLCLGELLRGRHDWPDVGNEDYCRLRAGGLAAGLLTAAIEILLENPATAKLHNSYLIFKAKYEWMNSTNKTFKSLYE